MISIINNPTTLGAQLDALYPQSSKNTIKKLLANGRVRVNGEPVKIAKTALSAGDRLEVTRKVFERSLNADLDLLYEDPHILVINKQENLLSIATEKEKEKTAYSFLYSYVKNQKPENRIFVVHRLDQRASGVLVFARTPEAKENLQAQFKKHSVERQYLAIVEGSVHDESGTIENYLAQNRANKVYVTHSASFGLPKAGHSKAWPLGGKLAITEYRVRKRSSKYTLLDVTTRTGRKHQIRVQLAGIGHPIIGDREYGSVKNPLQRLGLHAFRLGFVHPVTRKKMNFEVEAPPGFRSMFRGAVAGGSGK